ncbi:LOW QUALITY PROTEIN: hypothetical protein CKAN_00911900 [Cinnamomum micranthum f. kanehirae]|uniref:Non-specific lipid-transfer protein n=1 Tax=Cinnamomum micranthum f. kanehirae TaxID=337451 RepID=A0A3S3N455_9MAGN|nr:LOW QUALITY PROTEIN: hypothetical protein CKAN_00911900 [Cinnamomum micranthum f. kanehirae]
MARNAFAVVLVMMIMMEGWRSVAAISCSQALLSHHAGSTYVRGEILCPLCCAGLRVVVALSKENKDLLQVACQCMKNMVTSLPGAKDEFVNNIPVKCGVVRPSVGDVMISINRDDKDHIIRYN